MSAPRTIAAALDPARYDAIAELQISPPAIGDPLKRQQRGCAMSHPETVHAARFANGGSRAFKATNTRPADEVARLRQRWPDEFRDGARCAFLRRFDGARQEGGYPLGFRRWPLERRNAWFAGFNRGFHDRLGLLHAEAA